MRSPKLADEAGGIYQRWSIKRGSPYGSESWVESTAGRLALESTLRPRGRPRKLAAPSLKKSPDTFSWESSHVTNN